MKFSFANRTSKAALVVVTGALAALGCASHWKVRGGPQECMSMCSRWNLEFVGMVGLGSQDASGEGATACVCQVQKPGAPPPASSGAAPTSLLSAPIVAAEAAAMAHGEQVRELKKADMYG